jgi:uncharacterized protein (DUF4415 family)
MSGDAAKPTSRTKWDDLMNDDDTNIDCSDIPPLDDAFFDRAKLVMPHSVQLDPDILTWFKQQGQNYADQINRILRQYIETHDRAA